MAYRPLNRASVRKVGKFATMTAQAPSGPSSHAKAEDGWSSAKRDLVERSVALIQQAFVLPQSRMLVSLVCGGTRIRAPHRTKRRAEGRRPSATRMSRGARTIAKMRGEVPPRGVLASLGHHAGAVGQHQCGPVAMDPAAESGLGAGSPTLPGAPDRVRRSNTVLRSISAAARAVKIW